MKTKNTHGCFDHIDESDQKAMFIARFFAALAIVVTMFTLLAVGLYFKQLNDQDKRTEYIETGHSKIKEHGE